MTIIVLKKWALLRIMEEYLLKNKRQIIEGKRKIKIERCKFLNRSAIEYYANCKIFVLKSYIFQLLWDHVPKMMFFQIWEKLLVISHRKGSTRHDNKGEWTGHCCNELILNLDGMMGMPFTELHTNMYTCIDVTYLTLTVYCIYMEYRC